MSQMKKNFFLKIIILLILIMFISVFFGPKPSMAIDNIFKGGSEFLGHGEPVGSVMNTTVLKSTSDTIYNVLLITGIIIAVIVAMILGIQFMLASANDKAKLKEAIIPFVVGCIVVFGAFTIWKVTVEFAQQKGGKDVVLDGSHLDSNGVYTWEGEEGDGIIPADPDEKHEY